MTKRAFDTSRNWPIEPPRQSNDRNLWMSLGSWRESGRTSPRMIITGIRYSIKTGVGALVGKVRPCSR